VGDPRHRIGQAAERRVARWLEACGWLVLAERHRSAAGEIDVVALDPTGCLVAVEVKFRRTARAGLPAESVTAEAVRRRRAAITEYARLERVEHHGLRVDVVAVSPGPDPHSWHVVRLAGVDAW
jgi:putative endonuclease